ncbi:FAD/NAD(P)-binding domain-containing protein [Periconia macrospinosa]|uniref:FAD/NAD(P)-binding domain-containing protein n=1 Tax=Periconia macrospinosa TaxID=97972 RepID=A0A2V1DIL1_9PLEO|nr:FAD/NAD(P)-binding domain-containing protein [Periconia macrospinosa]
MTTETILILGGSFGGVSAAHYALRHIIPQLPKQDGKTYNVTLVNPSTDFYWRIAGPRVAASKTLMPYDKVFLPIEPHFAYAKDQFNFVQGTATSVDPVAQTVTVQTPSGERTVSYAALVIATGVSTPSPLFTQTTDRAALEAEFESFHKTLANAKSIVIGGAGPVGVETAGELGEFLNGKPGFFSSGPKKPKAKVTLISAEGKMLPILRESISKKAEKMLKALGVNVVYNTKVITATPSGEGGKTAVQLSNGETLDADIYIDATGARPNTSFLPSDWLDSRQKVAVNPKTLRVEAPGATRVYVVGDVGSHTRGGAIDLPNAIGTAMTNLRTDLIAHITQKAPGPDRHYEANLAESQIVPIGTSKGVGAFNGNALPSVMVWGMKGRDYMLGMLAQATLNGDNYKKEGKWKPQPLASSG